jgi:hypothetical protein
MRHVFMPYANENYVFSSAHQQTWSSVSQMSNAVTVAIVEQSVSHHSQRFRIFCFQLRSQNCEKKKNYYYLRHKFPSKWINSALTG